MSSLPLSCLILMGILVLPATLTLNHTAPWAPKVRDSTQHGQRVWEAFNLLPLKAGRPGWCLHCWPGAGGLGLLGSPGRNGTNLHRVVQPQPYLPPETTLSSPWASNVGVLSSKVLTPLTPFAFFVCVPIMSQKKSSSPTAPARRLK